jgi:hypothetical protein
MSEFINLRQDLNLDEEDEDDGVDFDGVKDYDDANGNSKVNERDLKESLFPKDYFTAFLKSR